MNIRTQFVPITAMLLLAAITGLGGCATIGTENAATTTWKMQTLEERIRQAVVQIDATEASLTELIRPDQTNLKNAFDGYAANVTKLDAIAMPLDDQINQINIRGKDYFAEWEREGDKYTNPQIAGLSEQRRADLSAVYARIPQANVGVMSALHAYMSYIIEARTYLSRDLTPRRIETITPVIRKAIKEGNDFKEGLKRVLTAMERVKTGATPAESSDAMQTFKSACLLQAAVVDCQALEKSIFKNSLPFQEFSPHDFTALDYPTDAGTLFLKMYSPRHTAALAYCYFASKGLINQKKVSASLFARGVNGFAILSSQLPAYEVWLKTNDGMQCRNNVENSVELSVMDLNDLLKNKLGMVALNPLSLASFNADINLVMNTMKQTLNHERIHVLQSSCPAIDVFAKESWAKLDPVKKAELKKDIPEYNWEDQRVAVREFLAFTYENDPSPLLDIAERCKF